MLNGLFEETVVKKQELEFDAGSVVKALNDEAETDRQRFNRLLRLAENFSADMKFPAAEQLHLV